MVASNLKSMIRACPMGVCKIKLPSGQVLAGWTAGLEASRAATDTGIIHGVSGTVRYLFDCDEIKHPKEGQVIMVTWPANGQPKQARVAIVRVDNGAARLEITPHYQEQ